MSNSSNSSRRLGPVAGEDLRLRSGCDVPERAGRTRASKLIGTTLVSAGLLCGTVGLTGTASGAATPPTPHASVHRLSEVRTLNWAGYVATGRKYTGVQGEWIVPAATCSHNENSASTTWVGLDGGASGSAAEQIGTETECVNGTPNYSVWTGAGASVQGTYPVTAGDLMFAQVTSNSTGTSYQLNLTDANTVTGAPIWQLGTVVPASPAGSDVTAEWITMQPSASTSPYLVTTDFGTVAFVNVEAVVNGASRDTISHLPHTEVYFMDRNDHVLPTSLSNGGLEFSVNWGVS
jgi:hypothetical protein